jgi:hypothetical protein
LQRQPPRKAAFKGRLCEAYLAAQHAAVDEDPALLGSAATKARPQLPSRRRLLFIIVQR